MPGQSPGLQGRLRSGTPRPSSRPTSPLPHPHSAGPHTPSAGLSRNCSPCAPALCGDLLWLPHFSPADCETALLTLAPNKLVTWPRSAAPSLGGSKWPSEGLSSTPPQRAVPGPPLPPSTIGRPLFSSNLGPGPQHSSDRPGPPARPPSFPASLDPSTDLSAPTLSRQRASLSPSESPGLPSGVLPSGADGAVGGRSPGPVLPHRGASCLLFPHTGLSSPHWRLGHWTLVGCF